MKTLTQLQEQRGELLTQARAALADIKDDTTEARAAELEAQHDAIMLKIDKIDADYARQQKLEAAEAREFEALENEARNRRPDAPEAGENRNQNEVAITYEEVFRHVLANGANTLSQRGREMLQERNGRTGHGLQNEIQQRAMNVGTPADGGYLVPEGFSGEIDKQLEDWGAMWRAGTTRQISTATGNKIPWPTLNYTAERGELHTEGGAVTNDGTGDPVIGIKELDAYIYNSPIVPISIELLQDSFFNVESLLAELFGEALGRTVNDVLTNGDGSSKPQGILTGAGAGTTATAATAVTSDEMIDLLHSVDPAYRRSPMCKWQFNDTTLAALRKVKDGDGNYLWQMGDIRVGEPSTLLGKGYDINSAMPNLVASATPILFGDHSRYVVRKVSDLQIVPFREKFMNNLQIGLMAFLRFDGEILNNTALKKLTMAAA
jgi:HK97 family phage major capsid protein